MPRGEFDVPVTLGRTNYLTVRTDLYDVIFRPNRGAAAMILAKNLSRDAALELVKDVNEALNRSVEASEEDFEEED